MVFLKKENWVLSLIFTILSQGVFSFVLGYFLKVYKKDAWYRKWQYWVISSLFLLFPVFIVLTVFLIQIACQVAKKLDVPGASIYTSPYSWILCLIVPIVGWTLLLVMLCYIMIWPTVMIYRGKGEKYTK